MLLVLSWVYGHTKTHKPVIWLSKSTVEVHIHVIRIEMSFLFRMELCLRRCSYTYWAFWFINWRNAYSSLLIKFSWIIHMCYLVEGCPSRVWRSIHMWVCVYIHILPFSGCLFHFAHCILNCSLLHV